MGTWQSIQKYGFSHVWGTVCRAWSDWSSTWTSKYFCFTAHGKNWSSKGLCTSWMFKACTACSYKECFCFSKGIFHWWFGHFPTWQSRGGASWSPTSRVLGHEGPKNLWLLCGNVFVLVASQNVRVASPPEALAQSVLNGDPVLPNIVNDGGQQSFLDARRVAAASEDGIVPSPSVLDDALPIRNTASSWRRAMTLFGVFDPVSLMVMTAMVMVVEMKNFFQMQFRAEEGQSQLLLLTETSDQERKCHTRSPREGHRWCLHTKCLQCLKKQVHQHRQVHLRRARMRRVLGPAFIEIVMIYLNNFVITLLVHKQYRQKIKEKQELCLQLSSLNR